MLAFTVHDDGSLHLYSDDSGAENVIVMDAFAEAEETLLLDEWESAPADDEGGVEMTVSSLDAGPALEALRPYFVGEVFAADEERRKLGL